jgi:glutamine amidotransferase
LRIAIIDYGSGNLKSATRAFERASQEAEIKAEIDLTNDAEQVRSADRIVLPGVGSFADCRSGLDQVPGMVEVLHEKVRDGDTPFLGICVGMQLMADRGLEKTVTAGLGWVGGEVVEMAPSDPSLKIPQIGWNTLNVRRQHPLLSGISTGPQGYHAYFVHSYHFRTATADTILATTDYGLEVTAMVVRDNMAGTQFHPEKSQTLGLALITNFLRWNP